MSAGTEAVAAAQAGTGRRARTPRTPWMRLLRDPAAVAGLVVICAVVSAAVLAPVIAPADPAFQHPDGLSADGRPVPPGSRFPLGTDLLGRDLLSRLLYGARVSLLVGVVANGAAVGIGALLGVTAGYFGGWVGILFMRFLDLMMAFPALVLGIALAAILKPSLWIVALVIGLVNWVWVARVIYGQTLSLAQREFVEAARALGAGPGRVLFRHLIPHLLPTLLVWGTLGISTTVLFEASLSFLGVGVRPPAPSWGGIINESQSYFLDAPWLVAFPGLAILLTSLSFSLVGETLRDALDPRRVSHG